MKLNTAEMVLDTQITGSDRIDRALIDEIAYGRSKDALERLYLQYRPRLVGFLRRLTRDDDLIEDVYNDVMLKVWNKSHQYRGNSKVSSWIFSIAYRSCLKLLRKQKVQQDLKEAFGNWITVLGEGSEGDSEQSDAIKKSLSSLSADHRLAIELCYFQGCSVEEISQIAGCPVNTVKTRLFHARKKMRDFIQQQESHLTRGET